MTVCLFLSRFLVTVVAGLLPTEIIAQLLKTVRLRRIVQWSRAHATIRPKSATHPETVFQFNNLLTGSHGS
jgi:hypothetical protein